MSVLPNVLHIFTKEELTQNSEAFNLEEMQIVLHEQSLKDLKEGYDKATQELYALQEEMLIETHPKFKKYQGSRVPLNQPFGGLVDLSNDLISELSEHQNAEKLEKMKDLETALYYMAAVYDWKIAFYRATEKGPSYHKLFLPSDSETASPYFTHPVDSLENSNKILEMERGFLTATRESDSFLPDALLRLNKKEQTAKRWFQTASISSILLVAAAAVALTLTGGAAAPFLLALLAIPALIFKSQQASADLKKEEQNFENTIATANLNWKKVQMTNNNDQAERFQEAHEALSKRDIDQEHSPQGLSFQGTRVSPESDNQIEIESSLESESDKTQDASLNESEPDNTQDGSLNEPDNTQDGSLSPRKERPKPNQ